MELIKHLPTKIINGRVVSYGLFLCPFCESEVERRLSNGIKAKYCGCNNKTNYKHGGKGTKLYNVWVAMKTRCLNPNHKQYKDWGGRGIKVCTEWLEFIPFRDWAIQNGYKEDLEIDRINNNGNYEPDNCRFVTSKENMRNKRGVKITLEIANEIRELYKTGSYKQQELAEFYNVSSRTISYIINNKIWNKK